MNPMLKHPILKQLDYNSIHTPTLEGIKASLTSKRRKLNLFVYFQTILLIVHAVNNLIIAERTSQSIVLGFLSLIMIPLLFWLFNREGDKYLLSESEILEEIEKHERWSA